MDCIYKTGIVSEVKTGYVKVYFEDLDLVTDWFPVVRMTSLKDKISFPLNVKEHVACICDERAEKGVVVGAIHNDQDAVDPSAGTAKFRMKFDDNTVLEYIKSSHTLNATVKGKVNITTDDDVTINSSAKVKSTSTGDTEITSTGKTKITATDDVEINSSAKVKVTAATNVEATATVEAKVTAPLVTITGNVVITGNLSFGGTMSGPGGSGFGFSGDTLSVPKVNASTEVKEGSIVLGTHVHGGVQSGSSNTGTPI